MNDEQTLMAMAEDNSTKEFLMLIKGYLLGYLGIPLNYGKISGLTQMIGFYEDWIDSETISRRNAISIFLNPLKKIKSFHNKTSSSQDYSNGI
jgi:hypothetical protein